MTDGIMDIVPVHTGWGYSWGASIAGIEINGEETGVRNGSERMDTRIRVTSAFAPGRANALIKLNCAKPGRFRCEIVGVNGKTVKVLADRSFPSGTHTVAWNGDNESGAPVAAGIYMLRVLEKDRASTMRIISVR